MGITEEIETLPRGVIRSDGLYFRLDPVDPERLQLLSIAEGEGYEVDGTFGSLHELGAIFAHQV